MSSVDPMPLGAHLNPDDPVDSVRYLGPKSKRELNELNIMTVADLVNYGVIDAFLAVKAAGHPVTLNFLWAMFAGLMDLDFHKIPKEFKGAVKSELKSDGKVDNPSTD